MSRRTRREILKEGGSAPAAASVAGTLGCGVGVPEPSRPPNILFFFPDQHRFDWVVMNPEVPFPTPNLERLKVLLPERAYGS